jgi:hypothetical protein
MGPVNRTVTGEAQNDLSGAAQAAPLAARLPTITARRAVIENPYRWWT